jgi:hypothetical protein
MITFRRPANSLRESQILYYMYCDHHPKSKPSGDSNSNNPSLLDGIGFRIITLVVRLLNYNNYQTLREEMKPHQFQYLWCK